jgi:hypothetical protein
MAAKGDSVKSAGHECFVQQHPSVTREQVLEVLEAAKAGVARTT